MQIFSAKSLRTPSNILVVNLAICDFFMMAKTPVFIYNSFSQGYAMGHLGCQIYGVIGSYTGIGTSTTNAFIAYDRYNVITRPMEGKMTMGKGLCMALFIWIYATPWSLAPAFEVWGKFVPGEWLLFHSSELVSILSTLFTFNQSAIYNPIKIDFENQFIYRNPTRVKVCGLSFNGKIVNWRLTFSRW